jgi:hypothetical protein
MSLDEDAPSKATLEKEREIRIQERRERIMQRIEAQKVGGEAQNAIAERERRKQVHQPRLPLPTRPIANVGVSRAGAARIPAAAQRPRRGGRLPAAHGAL